MPALNKVPQMIKRRIGNVDIIDLKGEFVGSWAVKGKEDIAQYLKENKTKNLLINLKGLSTWDSLGVKAVTENLCEGIRTALVMGNVSVMEMLSRVPGGQSLKCFRSEHEVIDFFGQSLVDLRFSVEEKRKHLRLKTALELEFNLEDPWIAHVHFRAVVTDLSEGGLFAEYLEMGQQSIEKAFMSPQDFGALKMILKFPGGKELSLRGRAVRLILEGAQAGMGVEFLELAPTDRHFILSFLQAASA